MQTAMAGEEGRGCCGPGCWLLVRSLLQSDPKQFYSHAQIEIRKGIDGSEPNQFQIAMAKLVGVEPREIPKRWVNAKEFRTSKRPKNLSGKAQTARKGLRILPSHMAGRRSAPRYSVQKPFGRREICCPSYESGRDCRSPLAEHRGDRPRAQAQRLFLAAQRAALANSRSGASRRHPPQARARRDDRDARADERGRKTRSAGIRRCSRVAIPRA